MVELSVMVALLVTATLFASGIFIHYRLGVPVASANRMIAPLAAGGVFLVAVLLREFAETLLFFSAAAVQFASFVFVSRLRQIAKGGERLHPPMLQ